MSHAVMVFYVLVALNGFVAVAVSVFGTLRSRIRAYWLLIAFYGLLTTRICVTAVEQYLALNVHPVSMDVFVTTGAVGTVLNAVFMCVVTLYFHRIFVEKAQALRDRLVVGAYAVGLVLILLPGARTVDLARGTMRFTALGSAAYFLLLGLFAYLLITGFAGPKKDRAPRELVLIWSLVLFGVVAFVSDVWGMVQYFVGPQEILLAPGGGSFMVSSIPHLVFGGILIYYFGAYVLADSYPAPSVRSGFVDDFGISPREREIIPLLNQGLSNREIAEKLFVSLATVKTHLHNIYEKTGAKSRYDLFNLSRAETQADRSTA